MEAEAAGTEPDDFLQPVKAGNRVSLDEEASPTAGRRFTRT
jgi:hypothetical protein